MISLLGAATTVGTTNHIPSLSLHQVGRDLLGCQKRDEMTRTDGSIGPELRLFFWLVDRFF